MMTYVLFYIITTIHNGVAVQTTQAHNSIFLDLKQCHEYGVKLEKTSTKDVTIGNTFCVEVK